jgi:catechol 2,3-dioxygenase-like lactoylglutathione lyase family enzyme
MRPVIDHVTLQVSDYEQSKVFYMKALLPLGIRLLVEEDNSAGFGRDRPEFWFYAGLAVKPPVHVAFTAENRGQVDAFYKAGLAAGGTDNGSPGVRAHYHAGYYAAFVRDPDGLNIEAVCHTAE